MPFTSHPSTTHEGVTEELAKALTILASQGLTLAAVEPSRDGRGVYARVNDSVNPCSRIIFGKRLSDCLHRIAINVPFTPEKGNILGQYSEDAFVIDEAKIADFKELVGEPVLG